MKIYYTLLRSVLASCFLLVSVTASLAQSSIRINHQPYLQALTDNSVSIVWTSDRPAIAWVELAPDDDTHFYKEERPRYFAANDGFKTIGRVHEVKLSDLEPNTTYRYRVYCQEVLEHVGHEVTYGKIAATGVYRQEPLQFITSGSQQNIRFAVVNDIHGKNDLLKKLINQVELEETDFIVFNGDMMDNLLSEDQMFSGFMDTATHLFASEIPMYYARGNHETRGPFATEFGKYFPTNSGKLYYTFQKGDAYFVVLDSGEDKPDTDIEYSGVVDMDNYRTEQARWLKDVLQSEAYQHAKYKIIICHMPPFGNWHGDKDVLDKFVPLLNDSGAQIMLSGHLHRHIIQEANETTKFPVVVNKNDHIIQVDLTDKRARFRIYDVEGKAVEELQVEALR